jgi:hypothetical protein
MDTFYRLESICPAHTKLGQLDATAIGIRCLDANVFTPSTVGLLVLIAHVVIVPGFLIWARVAKKEDASVVVGAAFESVLYTALGGYAGLVGGVLVGLIFPPLILGITFAILTVVCVIFMIVSVVRGTGEAGWKVAGVVEMLVLTAGLAVVTGYAFAVPTRNATSHYDDLINALAIVLCVAGAFHGFFASYLRGMFWWASPLLIPLNAIWGFLGNILGLFTFLASWNCWKDHGQNDGVRRAFVYFKDGMSLKTDEYNRPFAFTQGAVVSANTDDLRSHEAIHVVQHYVWGPIYPISHNVWFVLWAILVAPWAALAKSIAYGESVTALSYYDNPWEVMAYEVYGGRDVTKPLIWSKGLGWTVGVLWILAWTVGALVFLLWRFGVIQ